MLRFFHVPILYGVSLAEMITAGDTGDLDVVALLLYGIVMIECKLSLLRIDPPTLSNFFWCSAFFEANAGLLLVETPLPETSREFRETRNKRWSALLGKNRPNPGNRIERANDL